MKIQTNEIRVGNILGNNGKRCIVLKTATFKAGKGGAYIQVEMRDLIIWLKSNPASKRVNLETGLLIPMLMPIF